MTQIIPPDAALRLAAIVESSDDAIVSKDLSGIITSWNTGAERLFGYTADEARGRSITMLIPPDRLNEEDMVLGCVRRGERVEHFDTIRRRKDGTLIDISLTVSPIKDATGVVVGASKIARDVSDRKRVERELQESHRRLMGLAVASASLAGSASVDAVVSAAIALARDVFRADGYALWRVDGDGEWRVVRSVGVSLAFASRVIPARSPSPPVSLAEPIVCEDVMATPMLSHLRDTYAAEGIASMIVFPLTVRGERCGTMVFYSRTPCQYSPLDVQAGSAIANLAGASLTTAELYEEQQRAREAADRAHRRAEFMATAGAALNASLDYHATLKALARLIVPTVADWCAVDMLDDSGAVRRLAVAHRDPEKVALAHELRERYPPDPAAPGGPHEVIRTGEPAFIARVSPEMLDAAARDEEHRRSIARLGLRSYMCVPLVTHSHPFGAITLASAESDREYSEEDLVFARELAARASLAVENAQSYARAAEASRLKDEFLATLSHELRTPLNAVLGYTRMLRLGTIDVDKVAPALEVVERNAAALQQMIEDVLDVSRIIAGRLRLNVRPVDVAEILREACTTVTPAAHAKGVQLDAELGDAPVPLSGDGDRLQQIAWNLLSNAIKFTPSGGRVRLVLTPGERDIEIRVIDTGQGIPAGFLPSVFERFRQGDGTFSREQGGLGLGLAIARQLTELHGGTIAVASDGPGRGTTFTIRLPRGDGGGAPAPLPSEPTARGPISP